MNSFEDLVEKYIDTEPATVAMKTGSAELASRIKYLQRAKAKLPSWYRCRSLLDGVLFEQSSSEQSAQAKFEGREGSVALDLTCGLGVDSWALAANYQRVISVEIDPKRVEIARHNFALLGAKNIEVVSSTAESFIDSFEGCADLIYIDPSRIKDGRKVYSLEHSSPNVIDLLPKLLKISRTVIIKLSPLFDVEECFRVFGSGVRVGVLSSRGECKEVLVSWGGDEREVIEHIVVDGRGVRRYTLPRVSTSTHGREITEPRYLYVADVAFYKSRSIEKYMEWFAQGVEYEYSGYVLTSRTLPQGFEGQSFSISHVMPYNPKKLKPYLDKVATLHLRNFPYTTSKINKELKISEGGTQHLFFVTRGKEKTPTVIIAHKIGDK